MTEDTMAKYYTDEKRCDVDEVELKEVPAVEMLSKGRVLLLNLSWFGISLLLLVMSVEVIPSQMKALVGSRTKGRWLGGMVAGGAVLTFFMSPIVGMKSDRIQSRFGRRRPVMLTSICFLSLGLLGMALSAPELEIPGETISVITNEETGTCEKDLVAARCSAYQNDSVGTLIKEGVLTNKATGLLLQNREDDPVLSPDEPQTRGNLGLYVVFYLLVISSFAATTVPYNALIADKSHPTQRGFNSGVMGAMILTGNLAGAAVGVSLMKIGIYAMYASITGMVVLCVLITCATTTETPAKEQCQPLDLKTIFCGFWDPLRDNDFRWVFLTRFLMQQGVSTVTAFLEYWVADMVNLPNCWSPQTSVALLLLPLLGAAAICSIFCGFLSDRIGRRKPLVIVSAMLMCISTCVLAFTSGSYGYYVAVIMSFIFGLGFGSFQAVDFALVMDVLPTEKDKAKDIAVWHLAMILPQALATPIGGVILDVFEHVNCEIGLGYIILFLVTSCYFFLSGVFVVRITGVR